MSLGGATHPLPARILPGYVLREPLVRTAEYIMYRARRRQNGQAVIVKLAAQEAPAPGWLETLRREFDISHAVALPHALQPLEWLDQTAGVGLVFEDAPGLPLAALELPLPPERFFPLALALATAVGALHGQHVAHCALRPEHCLWEAERRRVRLTGFGHARLEDIESGEPEYGADLSALAYLAPEQTGRMGYEPDQRTDLYALGCIYYQLLTGAPPFAGADAGELIHAHLARRPKPPALAEAYPPALGKVLLKLLAKTPDDRYQSVEALLEDLQHCARSGDRRGRGWQPGELDRKRRFQLPGALYGRERELGRLQAALAQLKQGNPQMLLLSGPAGIGKSSLVASLRARHGREALFLQGKFEPLRRHIPYSAWIGAFTELVHELLTEPEERLQHWRQHLTHALRGQLRVLIDLIPDLAHIAGDGGSAVPLAAADAQKRFEMAFRSLIEALARPERPLVIFLDDLQWADGGSLQVLGGLLEDAALSHVMVIGAFRDTEISPVHPLMAMLDRLSPARARVQTLRLYPLEAASLNRLLADTLHRPPAETEPLAAWLHQRSDGNPLFARQVLLTLKDQGILRFEPGQARWCWTLEEADALGLADDILDLIGAKLRQLPAESQAWLATAACLGALIKPQLLAIACGKGEEALRQELQLAEDAQLLVSEGGAWRFAHDRVQQAAYALLPEHERARRHLRIARLLQTHLGEAALEQHLFEVTNQFNKARALLAEAPERLTVARLNLDAARRAKAAGAFAAARDCLVIGTDLLPERPWESQYELCFALALERAECEYVLGESATAQALFDTILSQARSRDDKARAYLIKIVLTTTADAPQEAVRLGSACLALYGVELPTTESEAAAALAQELERVQRYLAEHPVEHIGTVGAALDAPRFFVIEALMRIWTPAYQSGLNLLVLVTLKLVNAALESRDRRACAFAFMNYSLILGPFLGDYGRGAQFAELALELGRQTGDTGLQGRLLHVHAATSAHWTQPLRASIDALHEAQRLSAEAGDPLFAGMATSFLFRSMILAGERLDAILDEWDRFQPAIDRLNYLAVTLSFQLGRQWIRALKGKTLSPTSLTDEQFDEEALRQALYASSVRSPRHWYCVLKAMLAYFAGDLAAAEEAIAEADLNLEWAFGQAAVPEHVFFEALIRAARCRQLDPEAREEALRTIEARLRSMREWARHAPGNFEGRAQLMAAELYRLRGERQAAMDAYEAAVAAARSAGTLQVLALSHELAGRFYLEAGFGAMARAHLAEAHQDYLRWGASARAQQLAAALPELVTAAVPLRGREQPAAALDPADVATITKASQAIGGEIELSALVAKLLRFVMENAGADRVLLILQREGALFVEAEAEAEQELLAPRQATPLAEHGGCALSVVNYVRRTRKPLTLGSADTDQGFRADPWIEQRRPRSLLCLPIIRQGGLLGLLYLENGLTANAFGHRRAALLELLTAQLATALENALLYDNLKREIQERERAEAAARESERRWRAFLDNARLAVVALDLEGRVEYVNPYLLELTGFRRQELIGHNWFDTMMPARHRRHDLQQRYYQLLRDRPYSSVRGALVTRGGEERQLAWSNAWLRDAGGEVVGTVSIGEDITERLRAERENRRLNRDLENRVSERTAELNAANAELEAYAYSVSHDLRAPLRTIDGFSDALLEDYGERLDEDGRDYLERVRRASQRMGNLIDGILQMSRQTRGGLRQERVDLSALARDVAEELRERYPAHPVQLEIEPGLMARGDPRLLRVVLDNLLGNAWKYSRDAAEPQVSLRRSRQGTRQVFCVADNGAGFDMRFADRLFGTFQRLHSEQEFEGTGIGLATVQRIVRRHGGEIWAEGAVEEGSRFYFTLRPDGQG